MVWDDRGNEYIDGMASLWYVNVGHGRREIIDAVTAQMSEIAGVPLLRAVLERAGRRALPPRSPALAPMRRRARLPHDVRAPRPSTPRSSSRASPTCVPVGPGARSCSAAAAATTASPSEGMAAQGLPPNQEGFGPHVEGFENLPADDIEAWAAFMSEHGHRVAAVLAEPVQGAGGVYPPPDGFLEGLPQALRPARCVPDPRRGHLRVRSPRRVVRRAALRRRPRPHHVREGRQLGVRAARRRGRRTVGARTARDRRRRTCCATGTRTRGTRRARRRASRTSRCCATTTSSHVRRSSGNASPRGSARSRRTASSPRCAARARCGPSGLTPDRDAATRSATGCSATA